MSEAAAQSLLDCAALVRERSEPRFLAYCEERDWQKISPHDLAQIASEEAAVAIAEFYIRLNRGAAA